jgi:hypothetical protein
MAISGPEQPRALSFYTNRIPCMPSCDLGWTLWATVGVLDRDGLCGSPAFSSWQQPTGCTSSSHPKTHPHAGPTPPSGGASGATHGSSVRAVQGSGAAAGAAAGSGSGSATAPAHQGGTTPRKSATVKPKRLSDGDARVLGTGAGECIAPRCQLHDYEACFCVCTWLGCGKLAPDAPDAQFVPP